MKDSHYTYNGKKFSKESLIDFLSNGEFIKQTIEQKISWSFEWFGDWENDPENASKVVDGNGEPLVAYHGTNRYFTVFEKTSFGKLGQGIYFTQFKKDAKKYAKRFAGDRTVPVFLKAIDVAEISNPFAKKELPDKYDGIWAYKGGEGGEEIVVFDPNQIKLANGSNTTFDQNNSDIRFDAGGDISGNKAFGASSRFKPHETIVFDPPIVGVSGAQLLSYTWAYEWTMLPNYEGELVNKRVSDWERAQQSADTGKDIVHQFAVKMPTGEINTVSSESVLVLLGYTDRISIKSFPSLVNAMKTLAKQKMQMALLEVQEKEYKDLQHKFENANKPEVKEIEEPVSLVKKGMKDNAHTVYLMGDVWYRQDNPYDYIDGKAFHNKIGRPTKTTIEYLTHEWVQRRIKESGGSFPHGLYDLRKRVARQERKVKEITSQTVEETKKFASGGEINPIDYPSRIDTLNKYIHTKYPDLSLSRHRGKPSLYWSSDNDELSLSLTGLYSSTASGYLQTQTFEAWLKEADGIMVQVEQYRKDHSEYVDHPFSSKDKIVIVNYLRKAHLDSNKSNDEHEREHEQGHDDNDNKRQEGGDISKSAYGNEIAYDIPIEAHFKNKCDLEINTNEYLLSEASNYDGGIDELVEKLPIEIVDADKIIPTQNGLHSYKLDTIKGKIKELPLLCNRDGLYYIEDGTHRIAKCIIENVPIKARVYYFGENMFSPTGDSAKEGGVLLNEKYPLAPNGNKSNLSVLQHKLVRTPEFKNWFGNWENAPDNSSKVVDENGEPLIVYHGTPKVFSFFDMSKIGSNKGNYGHFGYGAYFSDDIREAKGYGENIITVFLNIRNPFLNENDFFDKLKEHGVENIEDKVNLSIDYDSLYNSIVEIDNTAGVLLDLMKKNGYQKGWELFLESNNPQDSKFDLNDISDVFRHTQESDGVPDYIEDYLKENSINVEFKTGYLHDQSLHWVTDLGNRAKEVTEAMVKIGYDGVIVGSEYVAFLPNQIKIADGSNATFDPNSPDIRYKDGGDVQDFDWMSLFSESIDKRSPQEIEKLNHEQYLEDRYKDSSFSKKWASTFREAKEKTLAEYFSGKKTFEDWSSRSYKTNKGNVWVGEELGGASKNIGSINESRKQRNILAAKMQMEDSLEDLRELGLSEDEINQQINQQMASGGVIKHHEIKSHLDTEKYLRKIFKDYLKVNIPMSTINKEADRIGRLAQKTWKNSKEYKKIFTAYEKDYEGEKKKNPDARIDWDGLDHFFIARHNYTTSAESKNKYPTGSVDSLRIYVRAGLPRMKKGKVISSVGSYFNQDINEDGVSVFVADYYGKSGYIVVDTNASSRLTMDYDEASSSKRPLYLVEGIEIGEGHDGEPTLDPISIKVIGLLDGDKVIPDQNAYVGEAYSGKSLKKYPLESKDIRFEEGGDIDILDNNNNNNKPITPAYLMTLSEYQQTVVPMIKEYKNFMKKHSEYFKPTGLVRAVTWNDIVSKINDQFYGDINPDNKNEFDWYKRLSDDQKTKIISEKLEKAEYEWVYSGVSSPNRSHPNKSGVPKELMEQHKLFNDFFVAIFGEKIMSEQYGIQLEESKSNKRSIRRAIDDDTYKKLLKENKISIEKVREVAESVGVKIPKKVTEGVRSSTLDDEKYAKLYNDIPPVNKEKLKELVIEIEKSFKELSNQIFESEKERNLNNIKIIQEKLDITKESFDGLMSYENVFEKLGKIIRVEKTERTAYNGRKIIETIEYYSIPPLTANWELNLDNGIRQYIEDLKWPFFRALLKNFEHINIPISEVGKGFVRLKRARWDNKKGDEFSVGNSVMEGTFNFKFENGSSFTFDTNVIAAGGHTIQRLHLRYLSDFSNAKDASGNTLPSASLYQIVENFSNKKELEKSNDPYDAVDNATTTDEVISAIFNYLKKSNEFSAVRKFSKSISYINELGRNRSIEFGQPPSGKLLMDLPQAKEKAITYLQNWAVPRK